MWRRARIARVQREAAGADRRRTECTARAIGIGRAWYAIGRPWDARALAHGQLRQFASELRSRAEARCCACRALLSLSRAHFLCVDPGLCVACTVAPAALLGANHRGAASDVGH
eukprot:3171797-Pleurochrysis_carterae.AAC.1